MMEMLFNALVDSEQFRDFKAIIEAFTGLDRDALHIHVGLAVFVLVRLCWRWNGGWILAWLAALGVAFGGEWLDLNGEMTREDFAPETSSWHDIWNTMLWPTIFLLIGRWLHPMKKILTRDDSKDSASFSSSPPEVNSERH